MGKMDRQALYHQLLSMRATIDAALVLLAPDEGKNCQHPKQKRTNLTTMGGPEHWKCECGFEYEEGNE